MPTQTRAELKGKFKKNAIPTEGNFADLIDSPLNQSDDGVSRKSMTEALRVDAGTAAGLPVLALYPDSKTSSPSWTISLNPDSRPGLGVGGPDGKTLLFMDTGGKVTLPGALTVAGSVTLQNSLGISGDVTLNGTLTAQGGLGRSRPISDFNSALESGFYETKMGSATGAPVPDFVHLIAVRHTNRDNNCQLQIASGFAEDDKLFFRKITDYGGTHAASKWYQIATVTSDGALVAKGAVVPSVGNGENAGIQFPADPGGGSGDRAFIRYYVESGENTRLRIGNTSDADDRISLYQTGADRLTVYKGCVGINNDAPAAALDIKSVTLNAYSSWCEAIRFSTESSAAIVHPGGGLLFGMNSDRKFYFCDTTGQRVIMYVDAKTGDAWCRGNLTTTNGVTATGNGSVLQVVGTDHAYMAWYPKGTAGGRKGWLGYDSAATTALTMSNGTGEVAVVASKTSVGGDLAVSGALSSKGALTVGGGAAVVGDLSVGPKITSSGRLHVYPSERLYLLPKDGVFITSDWGAAGNLVVTGTISAGGGITCAGNAPVLQLVGKDHAYMEWYPMATAAGRKGWIGYGGANTTTLSITNEAGPIALTATTTAVGGELSVAGEVSVGSVIKSSGRMHLTGGEYCYLLHKNGVIIGKEWQGSGNLSVEGDIGLGGALIIGEFVLYVDDHKLMLKKGTTTKQLF